MQNKEYATAALKDILRRALTAVALGQAGVEPASWDLEFVSMSREEQVDWLLRLFEVLVEHE